MKKFTTFLSMMLLFVMGTLSVSAQSPEFVYEVGNSVTEIPVDQDVVIRGGVNTGFTGSNSYLSNRNSWMATPDETCVFHFVQVGEIDVPTVGTLPTYALFNVNNGSYFTESATYSRSIADAFVFTAALSKGGTAPASWDGTYTFKDFYNMVMEEQLAAGIGQTFVFCKADLTSIVPTYLVYGSSLIAAYYNVNDFFVCPVTAREKTAREKFEEVFNEVFSSGFNPDSYTVGTTPGCVSQAGIDAMQAAYEAAFAAFADLSLSDEELNAVIEQIYAAQETFNASVVQVTPGYYVMLSQRSQDAVYDDGANVRCSTGYAVPEALTTSDARYIWEVVATDNGRYQLRNFVTNRYMDAGAGTSVIFTTSETPSATFNFTLLSGRYFGIQDQNGNWGHCDASMQFVLWNSTGTGNQFEFVPVSADAVEALRPAVEQDLLQSALAELVTEVQNGKKNYLYDSDVTFDDQYASDGLADPALMKTNAPESGEGYAIEDQFTQLSDGNLNTYFHTAWSNNDATTYHYLQVDLGKAVQKLFVKFSQRHNKPAENNPLYVAFVTNDDPLADVWTDTLRKDSVVYQYATDFSAGTRDSSTAVMHIEFEKPVQHLRFTVLGTFANTWHGAGVCWYVSEMRFYEDGGDNPLLSEIPQDVKDALDAALSAAETAVADSAATQELLDNLQAAWDAYVAAYPDPRPLQGLVDEARSLAEDAFEGDLVGYYAVGSKDALLAVVTEVEGAMSATLTLQQIAEYTDKLEAAMAAFRSKFNIPAEGYYRIMSTSPEGAGNGNYIYATAASETASARWSYKGDVNLEGRLDAIWYLSHNEDGSVSFRNVATGLYLGNTFEDAADPSTVGLSVALNYSLEPDSFRIGYAGSEGMMNIEMYDGRWINAAPEGGIVNWNGSAANSCFDFEPVDELNFYGETYVNLPAVGMQIMCLPYDIDGGFAMPTAYKVLGLRTDADGKGYIEMVPFEEGETLTAGTPFVVNPESETFLVSLTMGTTFEEIMNGDHGYEPDEVNGMVSAPSEVAPGAGRGLLVDGVVRLLLEGETVAAGTGYFTDKLPQTEEVGSLSIPVEGVINAIGGATVVDNAAEVDVYTLSGVKVRGNVKAADATKGLPTGLYIVGGQKVFVK